MPISLEKIVDLIRRTGETRVILDENANPAYVVMNFSDFQKLLGQPSTKSDPEKPMQKINEEVAAWQFKKQEEDLENWQDLALETEQPVAENSLNQANNQAAKRESDQKYYFEPID